MLVNKIMRKIINKHWLTPAVLAVFFSLSLSATAFAQHTFGEIEVTPSVSVIESYDDNISMTNTNEKSGCSTILRGGFDAKYEGKLDNGGLSAYLQRQMFSSNSNFDNNEVDITGRYSRELSKYDRYTLEDAFVHAAEPTSFSDAFGNASGRYSYDRNRFNFSYFKDITKQLTTIYRYGNEWTDYSRSNLNGSFYNSIGAGLEYAFDSATIGLLDYGLGYRDYEQGGNVVSNSLTGGLRRYLTSQMYLQGVTGLDFIKPVNGGNLTEPVFTLSLVDDVDDATQTNLTYTKEFVTSSSNSDVFDRWQFSAGITRQMMERLSGRLNAFYGEGKYDNSGREDKLTGVRLGFVYDLSRSTQGTLSYSYTKVDSTLISESYTRNSVSAGIRVKF